MIGRLRGTVDFLGEEYLILDVNGVGYRVFCSNKTLISLNKGQRAILLIETNVKEDRIHLYGFLSELDKVFFGELCKINGVGNKVALKIMSVLTTDDIILAVNSEDKTLFTQVPGVGPKLAQRIVTELKGSINKIMTRLSGENIDKNISMNNNYNNSQNTLREAEQSEQIENSDEESKEAIKTTNNINHILVKDAVSALENLGYKKNSIYPVVMKLIKENNDITLENLITNSLRELSVF